MKALEILKDIYETKWCGVKPTLANYNIKDIEEAIKELEEYESDMDKYLDCTTSSRCSKSFNSCLSSIKSIYDIELEEIIKENSQDRLAELEKAILDYYLSIGYKVSEGWWSFMINISTSYKFKEIQIKFCKDIKSDFEIVFRTHSETTEEMLDKAFNHFLTKGDNK